VENLGKLEKGLLMCQITLAVDKRIGILRACSRHLLIRDVAAGKNLELKMRCKREVPTKATVTIVVTAQLRSAELNPRLVELLLREIAVHEWVTFQVKSKLTRYHSSTLSLEVMLHIARCGSRTIAEKAFPKTSYSLKACLKWLRN
jgi:hypothetical protein